MGRLQIVLVCLVLMPRAFSLSISTPNEAQTNRVVSNILASLSSSKNGLNLSRIQEVFEVPTCMQKCLPSVDTFSSFFRSSDMEPTTIQRICGEVNSISQCAARTGCSVKLLDVAAGAFRFLCVDNVGLLPEALTCLQSAAPDLQEECATSCGFGSETITNSTLQLNMKTFCGSSVCLLKCAKVKLASKCNLGDHSILDAIVDNIQNGQNNGLDGVLDVVLPSQCSEIVRHEMKIGKVDSRPTSVGMTAPSRNVPPVTTAAPVFVKPAETVMKMDGHLRTLQCQVLDTDRKLVESPSFESLAKMISQNFPQPPPQSVSVNDISATEFEFDPSMRTENLPGIDVALLNNWRALHEARAPLESQHATSPSTLIVLLLFPFFYKVFMRFTPYI